MEVIHDTAIGGQPPLSARPSFAEGSRSYECTIGYASTAIDLIKSFKLPADPPSLELWYTYATGRDPALNKAVNAVLSRNGSVPLTALDQIYEQFLSSSGVAERIGTVGTKVKDHVDNVVELIGDAIQSATGYSNKLSATSLELARAVDRDSILSIVDRLTAATSEANGQSRLLQASLEASQQAIHQLQKQLETACAESLTDALTKIANRKHFDETLAQLIGQSTADKPLSLVMCDVDHFKQFNDRFGHLMGDQVLRLIACTIKQSVRSQDIPARFGGEEFAIILPDANLDQAWLAAENIRHAIGEKPLMKRSSGECLGSLTISVGIAELVPGESAQSLIERADRCLYSAKQAGRNRVCFIQTTEVESRAVEGK